MSLSFSQMEEALADARRTIQASDRMTAQMASLVAGRLRKGNVSHSTLCELKRELAKYNMHTGRWSE